MTRPLRVALLCAVLIAMVAPGAALAAPAGSTLLVSRPDGLGPVPAASDNNSSTPGALDASGRFAAFVSDADGLAPGTNPRVQNVYVRDRQTGTTTLVSRSDGLDGAGANGPSQKPAITVSAADGHVLVAFESTATNMSDHDSGAVANPDRVSEVWLRDVTVGTTTLVSRASGASGAPADESAHNPAITDSNGGPLVAFDSQATNLGGTGVLLRSIAAGFTQQVSCGHSDCTTPSSSPSSEPDIRIVPGDKGLCSATDNPLQLPCIHVAFASSDRTIFDTPNSQILVANAVAPLAAGLHPTTFKCCRLLSFAGGPGGAADAPATKPTFSGDGLAVGFLSAASNLGGGGPAGVQQAYVRGLGGPTLLLSKATAGDPANADVSSVSLAGSITNFSTLAGLRAVFATSATNLGGSGEQSYLRDVQGATASTTTLLNRAAGGSGAPGDASSGAPPAISADGITALFSTASSNLGDGSVDRFVRVHARRLSGLQDIDLVSRPTGTAPLVATGTDDSSFPAAGSVISANGRYVAFDSQSDSLSPVDDNRSTNVSVRDLLTGSTVLVNRANGANGPAADADSSVAGISGDGRRVTFTSAARDLSPDANGAPQAYVRDLDADTTTLVSRSADGAAAAAGATAEGISASGTAVIVTSSSALDRAGVGGVAHVYVRDLAAGTTTLADRDSGAAGAVPATASRSPAIDADGGRVAWVSRAALAGAPADGNEHVYLRDLRNHDTTLVSRANGAAGASADGGATNPAIDAAGDVVAFTSTAPNLGVAPGAAEVFARDTGTGQTELVSRRADGGPLPAAVAGSPSIDAVGDRISFLASGAIDAPGAQAFVRDRRDQTTTLVSRADGPGGAAADSDALASSISASGDCVAFAGRFANLGDGFASSDFGSVHVRVLRNVCPGADRVPGPGSGPGPVAGGPATTPSAPVLTALSVSPSRFHAQGRKRGTTIHFTLSQGSRVSLHFDRLIRGHRKGKKCRTSGRGKPCTIISKVGTLTVTGHAGRNQVRFSGKLRSRTLRAGS